MATTNLYIAPEDGWVDCQVTDAGFLKIMAFPSRTFYVFTGDTPDSDDVGMRIDPNKAFTVNQQIAGPVYVRVLDNAQPEPGQDIRIDIEQEVIFVAPGSTTITAPLGSQAASTSVSTTSSTEDIARVGIVTETAPASDTASSGLNGRLQRIAQRISSLITLVPTSLGAKAGASSFAVALSSEDNARVGTTTETAPATDTAMSGLNGRLQRIAQRLTSLIALLPASLGSKAASASLSTTPAGLEYETVAAGQTAQTLGATGATGDYLSHVLIQPATIAAGTTTILDNATVIFTFTTGTLPSLAPIYVPIGAFSVSGAWKITTGANVSATAFGDFT